MYAASEVWVGRLLSWSVFHIHWTNGGLWIVISGITCEVVRLKVGASIYSSHSASELQLE